MNLPLFARGLFLTIYRFKSLKSKILVASITDYHGFVKAAKIDIPYILYI